MAAKKTSKKSAERTVAKKTGNEKKRSTSPKNPPVSGQSGKPLDLEAQDLNSKEGCVVAALAGDVNPAPINALAAICFPNEGAKANSWVRNSLRRLVRARWVEKVGTGTYRLTDEGRSKNEAGQTSQMVQPA